MERNGRGREENGKGLKEKGRTIAESMEEEWKKLVEGEE